MLGFVGRGRGPSKGELSYLDADWGDAAWANGPTGVGGGSWIAAHLEPQEAYQKHPQVSTNLTQRKELAAEALLEPLGEPRQDLEDVTDDAVGSHFEDGRLGVLVDGDNHVGGAHPRQVLDRPRDATRDVEARG